MTSRLLLVLALLTIALGASAMPSYSITAQCSGGDAPGGGSSPPHGAIGRPSLEGRGAMRR